MDPMEDPDDVLRAHRSREKSYLFDVAFDFTATQVREGLGLGTCGSPSPTFDPPPRREPQGALPLTLRPPSTTSSLAFPSPASPCVQMRTPAGLVPSLPHGHTRVSAQTPPNTGTHTAHPRLVPTGAGGGRVKPIWCREESRGSGHPPRDPCLAHLGDAPRSRCNAASGQGARSQSWGQVSQVSSALFQAGVPHG